MRILSLGDRAFTVEFADGFDDAARAAVTRLDGAIMAARQSGSLAAILDVAPTFRSLTVHFDPLVTSRAELEREIRTLAEAPETDTPAQGALWKLPVLYGGAHGPDLPGLAEMANLSEAAIIDLHAETEVSVHMLGFLPGFAFMGDIAEPLRRPRLKDPRVRVPAGSVAVADRLTAVYPWDSPGGWHLIGSCPVPFFDPTWAQPSLLSPADRVRFDPISATRHKDLTHEIAAGELSAQSFRGVA